MISFFRARLSAISIEMNTNRLIIKIFIRPILEYCLPAWYPHHVKYSCELEKVYRHSTNISPALCDLPYEDRLRLLNLSTFEDRKMRGDLILTYKIVNGKSGLVIDDFFLNKQIF